LLQNRGVENVICMTNINNIFLYSLTLFKSVVALCQMYVSFPYVMACK